ncbi:MAG: RluA family pseudouridine synthase [Acidobacteriota bacterium]|nr:RluA family pseudouridine synthase [Acidobacteriota bacterium]MDE3146855.1 RluA family pseudouridine synthase [Acidobacteriota bacterium]
MNEHLDAFDGDVLDLIVPGTLDAIRVDRVIAMLTGLSRSEATTLVNEGSVSIDDKVVRKGSVVLEEGQHLVAVLPAPDTGVVEPDASVMVDVVLDDEDFAVVNKAAGQVVHPGAGQRTGTLVAGLLARYPQLRDLSDEGLSDPFRPGIVHRLDKGTSGVLVVAKTPEGLVSLRDQLATRSMERTYLGLVEGHVPEERGVVDAPIGRSARNPTLMAVRGDGRPARTGYEVLVRLEKPHAVTLLRLSLDTGRTHQIRVHMSTIGHPVVNDPRYGHRRDRRLDDERFWLHSRTLAFEHPRTGERVVAGASLPVDLASLVPGWEGA